MLDKTATEIMNQLYQSAINRKNCSIRVPPELVQLMCEPFIGAEDYCDIPQEDEVIFNGPATILNHSDGTKTVVKCNQDDNFDPRFGYLLAKYLKATGQTRTQVSKELKSVYNLWEQSTQKNAAIKAEKGKKCK